MAYSVINLEQWPRKHYFDHYFNQARCTYSMTATLDITNLLASARQHAYKLYPTLIYLLAKEVNRREEFRYDYTADKQVVLWEQKVPSYTVFHPEDETFSNLWTACHDSFAAFHEAYLQDIADYGNLHGFSTKPREPLNTFPVSCIPWVSFTGFQLNLYTEGTYLSPIFTIGKYFEQGGAVLMPISIQVHHAVCDGFHISRFLLGLQKLCDSTHDWM